MEYKPERGNIVADALSRKAYLVSIFTTNTNIQDAIEDGVQKDLWAKKLMELAT